MEEAKLSLSTEANQALVPRIRRGRRVLEFSSDGQSATTNPSPTWRINQVAVTTDDDAFDRVCETRLNETILAGDVRIDYAHYLRAFDEFYRDDVVVMDAASRLAVRGNAENRSRLGEFITHTHIVFEILGCRLRAFRLLQTAVAGDLFVSDWALEFDDAAGELRQMRWRIKRRWSGGKVVYEEHVRLPAGASQESKGANHV